MTGIFLLILGIVTFLAARSSGEQILYNISYLILGLVAVAFIMTRAAMRGLRVTRTSKFTNIPAGEQFEELITAENLSLMPKVWVTFHDHGRLPGHRFSVAVTFGPRQKRQWLVRTAAHTRGVYRVGPLEATAGDPFGIFTASRPVAPSYKVMVYPRMEEVPSEFFSSGPLINRRVSKVARPPASQSVVSVRDYQPGDTLSKISWKATARVGRLMAKEFEPDSEGDLWLILDMYSAVQWPAVDTMRPLEELPIVEESTEEIAVVTTASLARKALLKGRSVGLIAVGQRAEILTPGKGIPQLQKILESLASLRAVGTMSLHTLLLAESTRLYGDSVITVITADTSEQWARLLLSLFSGHKCSVVLVDAASCGAPQSENKAHPILVAGGARCTVVKCGVPLAQAMAVSPGI